MRRSLFAALALAALSILATALLDQPGVLSHCAGKLASYYQTLGLLDGPRLPHPGVQAFAVVLLAGFTAWVALDVPKTAHRWIVIIGTMLLVTSLSLTLLTVGIFFEPFSPLFAILVAALLSQAYSLTEAGSRKALLHLYLGDRISTGTFSRLLASVSSKFLEGRNCKVTVLSLRIFNLAALRAVLPPADLVEINAQFLRHSAEFLAHRGAYLDESSPDCVRAYFGLTGDDPQHAHAACQVARELTGRLANLNHELESRFFHPLEYGMALASGEVTVGAYRSRYLSKLSAIGDLAEYAHRLTGANAAYGSRILLNAETFSLIRNTYAVRPMELIYDASRELMAEAYELLDLKDRLTPAEESARERFWQGVILYREGRAEEALRLFSELQADRPGDRPLNYFIERAQALLLGETGPHSHPPLLLVNGHARILQSV